MKIEESERLAALLTAHMFDQDESRHHDDPADWRDTYRKVLAQFMALEALDAARKAEEEKNGRAQS